MKTLTLPILIVAFALFCLACLLTPPVQAQIVINEVLADPARDWDGDGALDFRQDEWVEIVNLGTAPVDLADYWLRDDSSRLPDYGLSGTLAPSQTKVVYGSEVMAWQQERGWLVTGFGLNNSGGDRVFLLYGPYSEELNYQILDQVWIGDHEADDDRSCGRDLVTGQWILFDGLNPYIGNEPPLGTGCLPTPGQPNTSSQPIPAQRMNFGDLKAVFR